MRVSINTETNTIVDTIPNAVNETTEFIVNNGYEILDIESPFIDGVARDLTQDEIALVVNNKSLKQIERLEQSLLRPTRELLSTNTSQIDKDIAQQKINEVEAKIQELRSRLV